MAMIYYGSYNMDTRDPDATGESEESKQLAAVSKGLAQKNAALGAFDPIKPGSAPLETIRDASGRIPDVIDMDCRITIGGIETTVGNAIKVGLISHSDVGMAEPRKTRQEQLSDQLAEAMRQAKQQQQPKQEEQTKDEPMMFEPDHEEIIQDVFDTLGQKVASDYAHHIIYSANIDQAIGNLASAMGVSPEDAAPDIHAIIADGEQKAAQYISRKCGIQDGMAAIDWARENLPRAIINQVSLQFFDGDMSGLKLLAAEYDKKAGAAARQAKLEAQLNAVSAARRGAR